MVFKRVRCWTLGRILLVWQFVMYPPPPGVHLQYYVTINFPLLVLSSNNVSFFRLSLWFFPVRSWWISLCPWSVDTVPARPVLEMVSKSLQGNGKTCPLCGETITLRKMNMNLAVRAMIAKILVHCINSGCAWTGEHDEMQNHSAICPFKIVSCPNGSQESYRQNAMDLHLAACPFQEVRCSFCNV